MDLIHLEMKELFIKSGGKILLNAEETSRVIERSTDWLYARRAQANGIKYTKFGKSKNGQVKYRIDHIACFVLGVNELAFNTTQNILMQLVSQKYSRRLSNKELMYIVSIKSVHTLGKYINSAVLPKGRQYTKGGNYTFHRNDVLKAILDLKYEAQHSQQS